MKIPLSLYAHIPFCVKKCPYCSFAVVVGQLDREEEYLKALALEGACAHAQVQTVYIGGGTPSCLSLDGIERLFGCIYNGVALDSGAEVSFEMNPEHVDGALARQLRAMGVNRVSLGAQSLDPATLSALGRSHRCEDVLRAFEALRSAGFSNISLDLIYGLPGQTREAVMNDLNGLLALRPEHLSLYALNIEARSLFFARRMAVDNDAQGELFMDICRTMASEGVHQYEVSNFARPGYESRHNMNYWEGGDYIGLGVGAHSHIRGERFWNADTLAAYLERMASQGSARTGEEKLAPAEKLVEEFLLALRMNRGVDLGALEKKFGMEMAMDKKETLESFIEMGLLEEHDLFIRATPRGRLLLDELSARIV